jgi:TPP-dependent pyruvate/acetoin dehydrogenase alpha subunit
MEEWLETKDPLPRYQKQLMDLGVLQQADVDRLRQ